MRAPIPVLAPTAAAPARAEALCHALGGEAGAARIVTGTVDRALADPRVAWSFGSTNHDRLRRLVARQIRHLAGGPRPPRGRGMRAAHAHLDLAERHFDAVVENPQASTAGAGVPFRAQDGLPALPALPAPTRREIVRR